MGTVGATPRSRPSELGLAGSRALLVRALGPGSMASVLKIALDMAYVALWAAAAGLAIGGIGLLIALPFKPGSLRGGIALDGRAVDVALLVGRGPQAAALIAAVELYLAALVVIFGRLRRVFETLIAGDPFRPDNVGRLRRVGLALIALEALGYLVRLAVFWLLPEAARRVHWSVNLTAWFAILVVFVLAEVFREGARLRRDAELTI